MTITTVTSNRFTVPARSTPSWFSSQAYSTWAAIPSSNNLSAENPEIDVGFVPVLSNGHSHIISGWNGAVLKGDYLVMGANGGHGSWPGNEVYEFGPFNSETPAWVRTTDPYSPHAVGVAYQAANQPATNHTYNHQVYIPELGGTPEPGRRLFKPFMRSIYVNNVSSSFDSSRAAAFLFNSETAATGGSWDAESYHPDVWGTWDATAEGLALWDSGNEVVWVLAGGTHRYWRTYNPRTRTYSGALCSQFNPLGVGAPDCCGLVIPSRNLLLMFGGGYLRAFDISGGASSAMPNAGVNVTTSGMPSGVQYGMVWEPVSGCPVVYKSGSTLYKITLPAAGQEFTGTYTFTPIIPVSGNPGANTSINGVGAYGRFQYISSLHAFCVIHNTDDPMYVYKIPEAGI